MRLFPILVVFSSACVTAANFGATAGDAFCGRFETCNAEAFNATFEDAPACREKATNIFSCYQDSCETFDAKLASACLDPWQSSDSSTCGDESPDLSACDSAWSDCTQLTLGACLLSAAFN